MAMSVIQIQSGHVAMKRRVDTASEEVPVAT